jgi:predicted RNase H-like nuclease (RuvC/YqgF family)
MEGKAEEVNKALAHYRKERTEFQHELSGLVYDMTVPTLDQRTAKNLEIEILALSRKLGNRDKLIEQLKKLQ